MGWYGRLYEKVWAHAADIRKGFAHVAVAL